MTEQTVAVAVIIGIINAVKKQFPQVAGLIAIGVSVVLGAALGYFGYLGVENVESGILVGLASSGVYTVAQRIGGN